MNTLGSEVYETQLLILPRLQPGGPEGGRSAEPFQRFPMHDSVMRKYLRNR